MTCESAKDVKPSGKMMPSRGYPSLKLKARTPGYGAGIAGRNCGRSALERGLVTLIFHKMMTPIAIIRFVAMWHRQRRKWSGKWLCVIISHMEITIVFFVTWCR